MEPFVFRHSTRQVIFGWGKLAHLVEIARGSGARRAVLVIDEFFAASDLPGRLSELLRPVLRSSPVLHHVPAAEPDTDTVEACHRVMVAADPDLIVAIGGGSTMDATKVARVMLANPGGAEAIAGFDREHAPHRSLLVCVPTTSGTGSEVSEMAVIGKTGSDIKLRYRSAELPAKIALLDPSLTVSMPRGVTVNTGFDAVTHALESYVSKDANPLSDPMALNALRLLVRWLPVAMVEPDHVEARSACMLASMQAAVAFNSTQLGIAHAIAAPLGALFHVVHGLGNALALPAVTAFNEPALGAKSALIAEAFGAATAADGVARFRHALGLDIGLDRFVDTQEGREAVAQAAMKSGNLRTNPRAVSIDQMRAIVAAMRAPTGPEAARLSSCLE